MPNTIESGVAADSFSFTFRISPGSDVVADVSALCEKLAAYLEERELSPLVENSLVLAVEELLTNLGKYARAKEGESAPIVARGEINIADGERCRLRLEDNCVPFDPRTAPQPVLSEDPVERAVGGLGLFMLFQIFELEYAYTGSGNATLWTMREKRQ